MINLRYHIVSITAIFLAIGIGLTLGSTFLDRATVDNLQGQLQRLETRLQDRESEVNALQEQLAASEARQEALDEQGTVLLSGRLEDEPVLVLGSRGVAESEVREAVEALVVAGADVQGLWWFTDRFLLGDGSSIDALAELLDETSTDPSRLRRVVVDALGRELRNRQLERAADDTTAGTQSPTGTEVPAGEPTAPDQTVPDQTVPDQTEPDASEQEPAPEGPAANGPAEADPAADEPPIPVSTALVEAGFIDFEPVAGGPETPTFAPGTRMLIVGGSADVPDDLVLGPLIARMTSVSAEPVPAVVSSAMPGTGGVSDAVTVIRETSAQRESISTVDDLDHFSGWAAVVLALAEVDDGVVGHYGLAEGATRLLPSPQVS